MESANGTFIDKGIVVIDMAERNSIMEQEIIVGLDIGTTKVCAVVAAADEGGRFNVLGVGRSPSDGLTRGVVTNIDKTVRSIQSAVAEAESRSGIKMVSTAPPTACSAPVISCACTRRCGKSFSP